MLACGKRNLTARCRLSLGTGSQRGPPRARVYERCWTNKMHRARQHERGVRCDELLRVFVSWCADQLRSAHVFLETSDLFAHAVAGGAKAQNRWAGARWHHAAPAGCAGAQPSALCPHPSTHWTGVAAGCLDWPFPAVLALSSTNPPSRMLAGASAASRTIGSVVEDVKTVVGASSVAAFSLEMTIASVCHDG